MGLNLRLNLRLGRTERRHGAQTGELAGLSAVDRSFKYGDGSVDCFGMTVLG